MTPDELKTMVFHILAIAMERRDVPVWIMAEELGQRLVAEEKAKTVPPPVLVTEEPLPVPDPTVALKQQLNEARLRLEDWVVNPKATECPECIKRKLQNLEAQKKWREKAAKKPKKVRKGNSRPKDAEKVVN